MRIRRVSVLLFRRKLDGRAFNPVFRWQERRAPLVVVETQAGVRGIGEGWAAYSEVDTALDALVKAAPRFVGAQVDEPRDVAAALMPELVGVPAWAVASVRSAIDIALWDAFAQEQEQPVWRSLGGLQDQAPVYASGGLYRDDFGPLDLHAEMAAYRAQGFDAMKMKIAGLPLAQDLERMRAVRDAIGDAATLWVDAVNQLDVERTRQWMTACKAIGIAAIQAPIPASDLDGLAEINRDIMPTIAAEAEHREEAFARLLARKSVTHLQFCLPLCGGFSGALRLDRLAREAGVTTTPQCFSTAIAQAASLHFGAAMPNAVRTEFHCFHDHLRHLYVDATGRIGEGVASAGMSAGLGVRIPDVGEQADGSWIDEIAA